MTETTNVKPLSQDQLGFLDALRPGGALRKLMELFSGADVGAILDFIKDLDLSHLKTMLQAWNDLMLATEWIGPRGKLAAVLRLVEAGALITNTPRDDELVDFARELLSNIGVLNATALRLQEMGQCAAAGKDAPRASSEFLSEITGRGFDIGKVTRWLDFILQVIELFRGINQPPEPDPETAQTDETQAPPPTTQEVVQPPTEPDPQAETGPGQ